MSNSPDPPASADGALEVVFATADPDLLPVIRSLLESAGIPFEVQGEHALGVLPTGVLGGPFATQGMAARFAVPAEHAAAARQLLEQDASVPEDEAGP